MARTFRQLSMDERCLLQTQLSMGWRPAAIAAGLQRARSTISREMARNGWLAAASRPTLGRTPIAGGYRVTHRAPRVLRMLHPSAPQENHSAGKPQQNSSSQMVPSTSSSTGPLQSTPLHLVLESTQYLNKFSRKTAFLNVSAPLSGDLP